MDAVDAVVDTGSLQKVERVGHVAGGALFACVCGEFQVAIDGPGLLVALDEELWWEGLLGGVQAEPMDDSLLDEGACLFNGLGAVLGLHVP